MKKLLLLVIVVSLISLACTHSVAIRPDLGLTANISKQMDFRIGLYIPDEVKSMLVQDNANWANAYEFDIGKSVSSIIYKAMVRVFKYVEILETYPTEQMMIDRKFDYVATVRITEANIGLSKDEGYFADKATGNTQLSVSITYLDKQLIQFTNVNATGTGQGKETIGLFSSGSDEYSRSVERSVISLGNAIAQQTYGNYDLRKKNDEIAK